MGLPPDQLLALGRQDYVVRSVRMDTKAETWNATFSKMYLIPSGAPDSIKDFLQEGEHTATATGGGPGMYTHSSAAAGFSVAVAARLKETAMCFLPSQTGLHYQGCTALQCCFMMSEGIKCALH